MLRFSGDERKGTKISAVTEQLINQLAKQLLLEAGLSGSPGSTKVNFESEIHDKILDVCDVAVRQGRAIQVKEQIKNSTMDEIIFSNNPTMTPEIKEYISQNNRDFSQHLLFKASSVQTLEYWFSPERATLPTDALALAIHLKSNPAVFEYLFSKTDYASSLSNADMHKLLNLAKVKLKPHREESYEFLLAKLEQRTVQKVAFP